MHQPRQPAAEPRRARRFGIAVVAALLVLTIAPNATATVPTMRKVAVPSDMRVPVMSCWSKTECLGFAQWELGGAPLLMRLRGSALTLTEAEESPAPTGVGVISCVSASWCMGTGSPSFGTSAIASRWDGTGWTSVDYAPARGARLPAIDCVSTTFCVAAGFYVPKHSNGLAMGDLIQQWNGKSWTRMTTPWPAPKGDGPVGTSLSDVSCASATFCIAVGTHYAGGVIERWNGKTWRNISVPGLGDIISLDHIECLSKKRCLAIGSDMNDLTAYRWDGTVWSKSSKKAMGSLKDMTDPVVLSCATATDCYAIASKYNLKKRQDRYYLYHWNGARWAAAAAPQRAKDTLSGLTCLSVGRCLAIGYQGFTPSTGKAIIAATFPVTVTG